MPSPQTSQDDDQYRNHRIRNLDDVKRALSFLNIIPPSEDYDFWIKVGMALHSVNISLLDAWETWSQGATNYEPGVCKKHWEYFKQDKGIGIGTLGKLAKQYGWQPSFRQIQGDSEIPHSNADKNQLLSERFEEQEEEHEELKQEVQNLVQLAEEPAPLYSLLSPRLMQLFERLKIRLNVPIEAFVGSLLAVCASLLEVGTRIEIDPETNFYPPPVLWVGLFGEPGSLKSPILTAIVRPLQALQGEADERYKLECDKYDQLIEGQQQLKGRRNHSVTEPVPREYFLDDVTSEALALCLSKQPKQGNLISVDELAGFLNSFDRYNGGRGGDRQKWLSLYNGGPIKVNRKKGDRISLDSTSVSLLSGIQPDVFRKHASRLNDADGLWSRFCWIRLPVSEMPPPSKGQHCNRAEVLKNLYTDLDALSAKTYRFDPRGQEIWRDWHCWTEKQKIQEYSPAMRVIYPKARERAARIALVAHCINAVAEARQPEEIISSELLEAAISFTKWLIGQTKLIYADLGATDHSLSPLIVRLIQRFKSEKDAQWIHARAVIHCSSSKKKPTAEEARVLMMQIVDLGCAIDNGKTGRGYAIKLCRDVENIGNKFPG